MREKDLSVLEQYGLKAEEARRGRGAYIITAGGRKLLLQEYYGSEKKACLQQKLLNQLEEGGYPNVDTLLSNLEGNVVSKDREGKAFLLKVKMEGRECDVYRRDELRSAAENLGRIHKLMRLQLQSGSGDNMSAADTPQSGSKDNRSMASDMSVCCSVYPSDSFGHTAARHNRELKKIRAFIRNKKNKSDFELYYLQYFTVFYEKAVHIQEQLSEEKYEQLHRQAVSDGCFRHGDYSQHHVLFGPKGVATINFEHYTADVQSGDLVHFVRKIMEKYDWDEALGRELIEAYNRVLPLNGLEYRYFVLRLAWPEKFWKLSNRYYTANKAWYCARNTSRLVRLAVQETKKEAFIRKL